MLLIYLKPYFKRTSLGIIVLLIFLLPITKAFSAEDSTAVLIQKRIDNVNTRMDYRSFHKKMERGEIIGISLGGGTIDHKTSLSIGLFQFITGSSSFFLTLGESIRTTNYDLSSTRFMEISTPQSYLSADFTVNGKIVFSPFYLNLGTGLNTSFIQFPKGKEKNSIQFPIFLLTGGIDISLFDFTPVEYMTGVNRNELYDILLGVHGTWYWDKSSSFDKTKKSLFNKSAIDIRISFLL